MSGSTAAARVVLGTAQFGLAYGVANTRGQVTPEEGHAILSQARQGGVCALDTAILYGQSESALGALGVSDWDVISKLPELPADTDADPWVAAQVDSSLERLRIDVLHGLLLHRPGQLAGPRGAELYRALVAQRELGRVRKIGISVYGPDELAALPRGMRFDIVQAPWNVLDQRMTRSGWADRLRAAGCEFHARSVFLQGLLLMPATFRPARFERWAPLFHAWDRWLSEFGLSPLHACLQHALHTPGIDCVVVGVDSAAQLTQILSITAHAGIPAPLPASVRTDDPALLNPALWNQA